MTPETLLAIMREVRDSSSLDLNPHDAGCSVRATGACGCAHSRRHVAAWKAFHGALAAAGVPSLVEVEATARGER